MFSLKTKFGLGDNRPKSLFLVGISIALITMILWPYMINGMWFDDAVNSQMWGEMNRFHSSVWDFSIRVTGNWVSDAGRMVFFFPGLFGFNYLLRDVRLIRLADMVFVFFHIGCVVYLLRQVRFSWPSIGIFVLLLVSLFQIRYNSDPVAAAAPFYQVLGILITVALIFLAKWHKTGSGGYLIASSLVLTLSLFFYEINSIYVPIAVIAILTATHAKRVRSLLIVLVPFTMWFALDLYIRRHAVNPYNGSTLGPLQTVPITFVKQFVGMFPGSFYLLHNRFDYPPAQLWNSLKASVIAWVIGVLSMVSYLFLAKRQEEAPSHISWGAVTTASAFVFLPPALIALSIKYQTQLTWGEPYLPVYYQYFGLAVLGSLASEKLAGIKNILLSVLVGLIFSVYVASNWVINIHQVTVLDGMYSEPRNSLVSALKSGLFDSVQDGDIVEMDNQPNFINGSLIYQTIEKNVSIPNETNIQGWFESKPRPFANRYKLFRNPASGNAWRLCPAPPEP